MKLGLNAIILGTLILFGKLAAQESERITGMWYVSVPGDYVGGGRANIYIEDCDGHFKAHRYGNYGVIIYCWEKNRGNFWDATFIPANNEVLIPGIYKGAQRSPFKEREHPGLDVGGDGRGNNTLVGEFEILEIEYNEEGEIESFAANFIQRGEYFGSRYKPPMFGGIRYNSSFPFEIGFITEIAEESDEILSEIDEDLLIKSHINFDQMQW